MTDENDQNVTVTTQYAVRTPTGRIVDGFVSRSAALVWIEADREQGRVSILLTRTRTVTLGEWTESEPAIPPGGGSDD